MTPTDQYSQRLAARETTKKHWDVVHARLGGVRLLLAAAAIATFWAAAQRADEAAWLSLPVGLFLVTVLYHQHVRARRDLAARAVAFYQRGLERLRSAVPAQEADGARFADPHHVYADDLDLFGRNSVYERLCSARTPMGEATLAAWLLAPAEVAVIGERHACIDELRRLLDLREDLQVLGVPARIVPRTDAIDAWAASPPGLGIPGLGAAAALLAVAALAGVAVWAIWGLLFPLVAVLAIEAAINYRLRVRVQSVIAGVEHAYEEIKLIATLLRRIESETFATPRLRALQQQLTSHGQSASVTFGQLATIVNFVEARRNPLLAPLLLPLMYAVQSALAAERWRKRHGPAVAAWLRVLGEVEALESIAGYSFDRPQDPMPQFIDGPAAFRAEGLGHPLIDAATRVRNDVDIAGATRVLLVSGSNMSGKSTLLRAVGVNTVLAMAGAPVCATRLRLTPLRVGASIRINDSLHEGSSRFYAEITRLRQLFDAPPGPGPPLPLIFLLDELLQGTNSADRRTGARGVVRALVERGAIGLVSTHDLALADDAALAHGALKNLHFQDELEDGRLRFDYKLQNGVVTKSNGIELMRAIGLDV